jgi:hypothetical protein
MNQKGNFKNNGNNIKIQLSKIQTKLNSKDQKLPDQLRKNYRKIAIKLTEMMNNAGWKQIYLHACFAVIGVAITITCMHKHLQQPQFAQKIKYFEN